MEVSLKGRIKALYPNLKGRNWITKIGDDDRAVLIWHWRKAGQYGKLGGIARAKSAKRDGNGKFISNKSLDACCT